MEILNPKEKEIDSRYHQAVFGKINNSQLGDTEIKKDDFKSRKISQDIR